MAAAVKHVFLIITCAEHDNSKTDYRNKKTDKISLVYLHTEFINEGTFI